MSFSSLLSMKYIKYKVNSLANWKLSMKQIFVLKKRSCFHYWPSEAFSTSFKQTSTLILHFHAIYVLPISEFIVYLQLSIAFTNKIDIHENDKTIIDEMEKNSKRKRKSEMLIHIICITFRLIIYPFIPCGSTAFKFQLS